MKQTDTILATVDWSGITSPSSPANATAYAWPVDRRRRWSRGRHAAVDATGAAAELLQRLPAQDETTHLLMNGSFAMIHLAPAIVKLSGKPIDSLTVLTLGWNAATTGQLVAMKKSGDIGEARVVASHYFRGADATEYERGRAELIEAGIAVTYARTHIKAMLATIGETKITATGSANFRSCANLENLCVTGDPAAHQLFDTLANDIFSNPEKYQR